MLRYVVLLACACAASAATCADGQTKQVAIPDDFASTLYKAVLENNASIRNYDVLIEHRVSSDRVTAENPALCRLVRQIVDTDRQQFLLTAQTKFETLGDGESSLSHFTIRFGDGALCTWTKGLGRVRKSKSGVVSSAFKARWSFFNLTGINLFPDQDPRALNPAIVADFLRTQAYGVRVVNVSADSAVLERSSVSKVGDSIRIRHKVDLDRFVILETTCFLKHPNAARSYVKFRQSIDWEALDGVYVPVAVTAEQVHGDPFGDGVSEFIDVRLHWYGIQMTPSDSDLALARFRTIAQIAEAVRFPDSS